MKKIYNDDCFKRMEKLHFEKVKFDLILIDPPYGTVKGLILDGWNTQKSTGWDIKLNTSLIFDFANKLLRENGYLIIFSQSPYTEELRTFNHRNIIFSKSAIWLKNNFANSLYCKKNLLSIFEDINIFYKKYDDDGSNELRQYSRSIMKSLELNKKEFNKTLGHRKAEHFFYWDTLQFKLPTKQTYQELIDVFNIDKLDFFMSYEDLKIKNEKYKKIFNLPEGKKFKNNVFEYKKTSNLHPTEKPILLLEDLIKTFTNENQNVLDFCAGSGSTGKACMNTNRGFTLVENSVRFYNIIQKRLKD